MPSRKLIIQLSSLVFKTLSHRPKAVSQTCLGTLSSTESIMERFATLSCPETFSHLTTSTKHSISYIIHSQVHLLCNTQFDFILLSRICFLLQSFAQFYHSVNDIFDTFPYFHTPCSLGISISLSVAKLAYPLPLPPPSPSDLNSATPNIFDHSG